MGESGAVKSLAKSLARRGWQVEDGREPNIPYTSMIWINASCQTLEVRAELAYKYVAQHISKTNQWSQ